MKITLWCLGLAILFHAGQSTNEGTEAFTIIPIPKREIGYSHFGSMVLIAENGMDSFPTENQVPGCTRITVTCPERADTPIRFSVSVTGVKQMGDLLYNWSVSKGTISWGQGTAAIEVDATVMGQEPIIATVEIGGIDPNCPRVASCPLVIP